jgi:hypothetical protein
MLQESRHSHNQYVYSPIVDAPYALCPGCDECPAPEPPPCVDTEPQQLAFAFRSGRAAHAE